jgi:hypothetical protein
MVEFLTSWWGLLVVLLFVAIKAAMDYQGTKDRIKVLIWQAEEQARLQAIKGGREKLAWVVNNGYQYLPAWLRLVLSEMAFQALVQSVFDSMEKWVTERGLNDRAGP